jgi:predicted AAA+ superfamily ATPase
MLEQLLKEKYNGEKQVVFIDELPWMDTPKSGFITAFEAFWNGWAYGRNIMVIICGSATSWLLNKIINNHGGLYGRVTYEIRLLPFSLKECEEFLNNKHINYSRYDITQAYMAVGGIPYYLNYFKKEKKKTVQNIINYFNF